MLCYYTVFNLRGRDLWFITRFWIFTTEFFVTLLWVTVRGGEGGGRGQIANTGDKNPSSISFNYYNYYKIMT